MPTLADPDIFHEIQRLRCAVEGAHDGLFEWCMGEERVYVSLSWQEALGYCAADPYLQTDFVAGLLHPDDLAQVQDDLAQCFAQGAAIFAQAYRFAHRTQGYRWYAVRATVQYDAHHCPDRLVGTLTDMPQRQQHTQTQHERDQHDTRQRLLTTFRALTTTLDPQAIIALALERSAEFFPYEVISYLQLDAVHRITRCTSYAPAIAPGLQQGSPASPLSSHDVPALSAVVRTGRLRHEPRIVLQEAALPYLIAPELVAPCQAITGGPASWLGIPIIIEGNAGGNLHGIISILHRTPDAFSSQHLIQVQSYLEQMAFSIQRAALHEREKDIATQDERRRIASDLHDGLSQTLFSAHMIAQSLPRLWHKNRAEAEVYLHDLQTMTHSALTEMRMLLLELRPESLVQTPLDALLRQLLDSFGQRTGVATQLHVLGAVRLLQPDVQIALYRIAQETLNNVHKHAAATTVQARLQFTALQVALQIADDGLGFTLHDIPIGHMGIEIMRERAQRIGAYLSIESQHEMGTTVTLKWRDADAHAGATS